MPLFCFLRTKFTSPQRGEVDLLLAMRSIVQCKSGEGCYFLRPYPLTPTLSQWERERTSDDRYGSTLSTCSRLTRSIAWPQGNVSPCAPTRERKVMNGATVRWPSSLWAAVTPSGPDLPEL